MQVIEGCSFAFSGLVYRDGVRLDSSVPDGLSTTVAISEHYKSCGPASFHYPATGSHCYAASGQIPCPAATSVGRRTTFADYPMFDDVHPVTTNGVTVGSLPLTFQVQPAVEQCDPRIPNSSLPGGILAGMLDGSAKFVRTGVSAEVFWGSVTPAGGEVVSLD